MADLYEWSDWAQSLGFDSEIEMWHTCLGLLRFTQSEMADLLGCSLPTVVSRLKRSGFQPKDMDPRTRSDMLAIVNATKHLQRGGRRRQLVADVRKARRMEKVLALRKARRQG